MPITVDGVVHRFASADDHVREPAGLWTDRLPAARWGERVPQVVTTADGTRVWTVDGRPVEGGPDPSVEDADPRERLRAMDEQGVDASVLYPTVAGVAGEGLGRITDPELEVACVRAYNDWLIDEWAAASPRLVPLCVVPLHPVDAAVAELERAVGRGARGLVYPALPMFVRDVPEISPDEHAPLWQACAALGVPVSFHSGVADQIVAPAPQGATPEYAAALATVNRPISSALFVAHLLLSQVLAPHPELRAVFPENSVAWMGFALETMDYLVAVDRLNVDTYDRMPSEVFASQCHVVGSYERLDRCSTDLVPLSNVLWSSAYPGPSTTWPDTATTVGAGLAGTPAGDRARVLWDNTAALYGLADLPLPVGAQAEGG